MSESAFDYNKHLIALFYRGSQAYGTATPESDADLGGILIPPKRYFLGFCDTFDQADKLGSLLPVFERFKPQIPAWDNGVEGTLWNIIKFVKLASDCNPNMIELLFLEESDYLHKTSEFEKILNIRDLFLSKKARFTFSGYAFSQIKRIKTHKKWLLNPADTRPERSDFGLPETKTSQYKDAESLIRHEVDHWAFHDLDLSPEIQSAVKDKISEQIAFTKYNDIDLQDNETVREAAMRKIGFDDNLMAVIQKENEYRKALTGHKQYLHWKANRNEKRAILEEKYGFDCKHGAHVVRLLRMGEEILRDGKVIVKRPDAKELLSIRAGAWTYDKLLEYAEEMQNKLKDLYESSTLRKSSDVNKINETVIDIVENSIL